MNLCSCRCVANLGWVIASPEINSEGFLAAGLHPKYFRRTGAWARLPSAGSGDTGKVLLPVCNPLSKPFGDQMGLGIQNFGNFRK